jgi:hypothetical protein
MRGPPRGRSLLAHALTVTADRDSALEFAAVALESELAGPATRSDKLTVPQLLKAIGVLTGAKREAVRRACRGSSWSSASRSFPLPRAHRSRRRFAQPAGAADRPQALGRGVKTSGPHRGASRGDESFGCRPLRSSGSASGHLDSRRRLRSRRGGQRAHPTSRRSTTAEALRHATTGARPGGALPLRSRLGGGAAPDPSPRHGRCRAGRQSSSRTLFASYGEDGCSK